MDEDGAVLGVGFVIDFYDSFGQLKSLDDLIGTSSANAVRQFEKLEAASREAVDLTGATAQVRSFGNAASREMQATAREVGRAETAGEALVRQLDRQNAAFGKSRAELRETRVETAAVAAERAGLSELATRLIEGEIALQAKEIAAAEQAASARISAAQRAADAEIASLRAVNEQLAERARMEAAIERNTGVNRVRATDAGAGYSALAAQVEETERLAQAAIHLKSSIDPAFAAQVRFDTEMEKARTLISAGVISLDDYVAKLRIERGVLSAATDTYARNTASMGAHRAAMQGLSYQAQDTFTQISMGTNILSVLAIQGGQAFGQMVHLDGQLGKIANFMVGPWGLAITAGMLVLGALTDSLLNNEEAVNKAEAAMRKFQDRQSDIANFIDFTTGKVIEQNRELVINAVLLRQKSIAENEETIRGQQAEAFRLARTSRDPNPGYAGTSTAGSAIISQVTDPRVAAIIKQANGDVAKLTDGLAALAKQSGDKRIGDLALSVSTVAAEAVIASRDNARLGKELRALNGDTTALATSTTALIDKQVALTTATTPLETARAKLSLVQQSATAADKAGGAALQKYRDDLTAATKAVKSAEAAEKAANAARRDGRRDANHAAGLARDTEAVEAQITNLGLLADAYRESGGAAMIAEARLKAESEAIKKRADVDAAVDRQLRLSMAQRISDAGKNMLSMREQSTAQEEVNGLVKAGLVPAQRAADMIKDRIADLPILTALEVAEQRGMLADVQRLTLALKDQREERETLRIAGLNTQVNAGVSAGQDRLAELKEELRLIGETEDARSIAMATFRAQQEASKWTGADPDEIAKYVRVQGQIATQTAANAQAQRNYNDELSFTADRWDLIARNVDLAARDMADAFGDVGRAIGDMASVYAGYHADQARMVEEHNARIKAAGKDEAAIQRENARYGVASATTQVGLYGDMATAAKGFFKEGSDGYQAMAAAEKAFRAVEFALSVRAMAQDAIETASSLAKSGARTDTKAVEAVVSAIASLPFPLNIAAGAATVAALAAIGVSVAGSFGGSKNNLPKANDGTGTVLGDVTAKSESIKRSIDALKDVDTVMLTYSRQMAASLQSIESQIGGFASLVLRTGDINASGGVNTGFAQNTTGKVLEGIITGGGILSKIPIVGGIIGGVGKLIGSLFGTKTKVVGSGLYGDSQSLGDILSSGYDASYYSDVQKKKKLFGVTTSTKYSTKYSDADGGLENQFTLILRGFNDAILAAAGPLGAATDEIQRRLNGFVLNIGKIDLQGLTGAEIEEKLTAVFGKAADEMATAAFPGIEKFQAVGEGLFETLVRVASTVESVTSSLGQLGSSAVLMSTDLKMSLAAQFDSVSDFTSAVDGYFEVYYTKAEQAAARTAQFATVFDSLGLAMPGTLAGFRQLVEAQDLTTAAGQATYATLLQLAPAFADLQSALNGAKSAADILSERQDLQRQMLELQGNTAAIRALDLAKLDASNRALQEQIWAVQDAQSAAAAAAQLKDAWTSVGDSIMDEVNRIRGLTDGTSSGSFASLLGQFNAATAAARAGDQDAASSLVGLSQSLLNVAGNTATSRQELERVKAQTAASLEATYGLIGAITGASSTPSTSSVLSAVATAAQVAGTTTPANDDVRAGLQALRDEIAQMRNENNAGHAANAGNTGRIARKLDDVTFASGGTAVSVAGAA